MGDLTKPQVTDEGTIEILRVLCGSRAHGLHDDDSDFDYHGVFVVPTERLLALDMDGPIKTPKTLWIEGQEKDDVSWEVSHFLALALRCNPTVLETFVAPIAPRSVMSGFTEHYTDKIISWGLKLRGDLFPAVLSRKQVFESYRGYAHNQRKKMFEPSGGVRASERSDKFAVQYLRVLRQGEVLLKHGGLEIETHGGFKLFLLEVKHGEVSQGDVINYAQHRRWCPR